MLAVSRGDEHLWDVCPINELKALLQLVSLLGNSHVEHDIWPPVSPAEICWAGVPRISVFISQMIDRYILCKGDGYQLRYVM